MIPKKIHYVWVGGPLPDKQRTYVDSWFAHNQHYEFVLWNESNIDFSEKFVADAYKEKKWAKVADAVRLRAVLDQGGIYLDTDVRVFKTLDPLLENPCFFGFQSRQSSTDWVGNAVFGAQPGHWFIAKVWDRLRHITTIPFRLERPTKFGPKLVTRLLREEGLRTYSDDGVLVKDIFIHPRETFFPFAFGEQFTEACVSPRTLAAHFWEKTWDKDIPRPIKIACSLRDFLRLKVK